MEEQLNPSSMDLKQSSNDTSKPSRNRKRTSDEACLDICSHSENHFNPLKRQNTMSDDQPTASLTTLNPNSSKPWMLRAVGYLKFGQIHKAKMLLKRGIATINFREDEEQVNLWKSLLNLEAYYGSREALLATFEEAIKYDDTRKIYIYMLQLLINTEKTEALEIFKDKLLKKCKTEKEVYLVLCEYYMKHGLKKEGRVLFERGLQCVSPKEHPDMLGKFAILEYKYGDIERSQTLYKQLIISYPKRKDLASAYIQVLRREKQENARKS